MTSKVNNNPLQPNDNELKQWQKALERAKASPRCGAKTRSATECKSPAMLNGRCRMHGGASTGAPKGNQNALKHGLYGREMKEMRRHVRELREEAKEWVEVVD